MSESRIFSSSVESVRPRRRCASPTRLRKRPSPACCSRFRSSSVYCGRSGVGCTGRSSCHRPSWRSVSVAPTMRGTVKCRAASAVSRGSSALRYKNKTAASGLPQEVSLRTSSSVRVIPGMVLHTPYNKNFEMIIPQFRESGKRRARKSADSRSEKFWNGRNISPAGASNKRNSPGRQIGRDIV